MQIIEAPAAPLSTHNIIRSIPLTTAEKKSVADAEKKIADLMEIIRTNQPDDGSGKHHLHDVMDSAAQAFQSTPTAENAAAYAVAVSNWKNAEHAFPVLNQACHHHFVLIQNSVQGVADAVIDRASERLATEAASVRAGLVKAEAVFGASEELAAFDSRLQATSAALADERTQARSAPLAWIKRHELA